MRKRFTVHVALGLAAALLAPPAPLWAQGGGHPVPPAGSAQPTSTPPPAPGEPYSYNPEGRRDPFVSLMSHGVDQTSTGKRSEGLAGLMTSEVMVKGVLLSRGSYVALVQGIDGKTYNAHVNDRLADGQIRSITPQGLVIMQEVNDPLSLIKQKEVRKGLRASDDGKQ